MTRNQKPKTRDALTLLPPAGGVRKLASSACLAFWGGCLHKLLHHRLYINTPTTSLTIAMLSKLRNLPRLRGKRSHSTSTSYGFRLRWRAKLERYPAPIRYAGFTLIELSIVLVIIGLLVGGVLVGQDLIRAAQLRGVQSDVAKFQTATYAFKLKYNCIAGDCNSAASLLSGTSNGNGNKLIDGGSGCTSPTEAWLFWQHLALAGLIEGTYSGVCPVDGQLLGRDVPTADITGAGYQFMTISKQTTTWINAPTHAESFIRLGKVVDDVGTSQDRIGDGVITCTEIIKLEEKLDDGLPSKGKIWVNRGGSSCITNNDYLTSAYTVSSATGVVIVHFDMDL